jgi:DNA-binding MarR family transcriptional regulator
MTNAALEPYGISGRELGVLTELADGEPASQQDAARRIGVDRTSMVAFIDTLEAKGLVERRPHALDRRRNVVALTAAGRETLREATSVSAQVERDFLTPLTGLTGQQLKDALGSLIEGSA